MRNLVLVFLLLGCTPEAQYHVGDRVEINRGVYKGCTATISNFRVGNCLFSGGLYTLRDIDCLANGYVFHTDMELLCFTELK